MGRMHLKTQERLKQVIELLRQKPYTVKELAAIFSKSHDMISADFKEIRKQGIKIEMQNTETKAKAFYIREIEPTAFSEKTFEEMDEKPPKLKDIHQEGVKLLVLGKMEQAVKDFRTPRVFGGSNNNEKSQLKQAIKNDARKYLLSEIFLDDCEFVGINRNAVLEKVGLRA